MKVQIFKGAGRDGGNLCWITANRVEALALIQSLAHQLETGTPNGGRLESRCTGNKITEMSIAVHAEE
jgi:hypothetical protein